MLHKSVRLHSEQERWEVTEGRLTETPFRKVTWAAAMRIRPSLAQTLTVHRHRSRLWGPNGREGHQRPWPRRSSHPKGRAHPTVGRMAGRVRKALRGVPFPSRFPVSSFPAQAASPSAWPCRWQTLLLRRVPPYAGSFQTL